MARRAAHTTFYRIGMASHLDRLRGGKTLRSKPRAACALRALAQVCLHYIARPLLTFDASTPPGSLHTPFSFYQFHTTPSPYGR